ncbi:MAG: hypothetical protein DRP87_07710 [Spirochaetes bacterium]|nr:MAG: hypothetical protein DRP87_07710 [Spirochaetota bacterium]
MNYFTGLELVKQIREVRNDLIALIISAYTDTDDLIDAVNSNLIYKYIVKPFSHDFLLQNVFRAEEHLRVRREKEELENILRQNNARLLEENRRLAGDADIYLDRFVGFAPKIKQIKDRVRIYASYDQSVLISGETGTGKELLARAIHRLSPRSGRPFLTINCSTLPENLLESEMFGYEKGAFTGADSRKKGLFSVAHGGTILLDEISDLPLRLQPKLLRVLRFGTFFPVGSTREETVDVRIISATNKDVKKEIPKGSFRKDLFYRINTLQIHIPPLRERKEDIFPILESFAVKRGIVLPRFSLKAKEMLLSYSYPGNVRELENILEKLHLFSSDHGIEIISGDLLAEVMGEETKKNYYPETALTKAVLSILPNGRIKLPEYLGKIEEEIIKSYYNKNRRQYHQNGRTSFFKQAGFEEQAG